MSIKDKEIIKLNSETIAAFSPLVGQVKNLNSQ